MLELKTARKNVLAEIEAAQGATDSGSEVTPEKVSIFAAAAQRRIRMEGSNYARHYIRAVTSRIDVHGSRVRIRAARHSSYMNAADKEAMLSAG